MITKTLIGRVPVDSGQIMIVDPCYVLEGDVTFETHENGNMTVVEDNPYSRACAASMGGEMAGPFSTHGGNMDDAVCSSSGYGDGMYPVYIEYEDCGSWGVRVKSITIEFINEDEDDWED